MADRVAVGRIVHGSGSKRVTIEPGERFDTSKLQLSDEDVERLDRNGVLREPRDETGRATMAAGPGGESADEIQPTTEGRSGPATNVRSPAADLDQDVEAAPHDLDRELEEAAQEEHHEDEENHTGRRGRRRHTADDL